LAFGEKSRTRKENGFELFSTVAILANSNYSIITIYI
jgi:hypothetical protein